MLKFILIPECCDITNVVQCSFELSDLNFDIFKENSDFYSFDVFLQRIYNYVYTSGRVSDKNYRPKITAGFSIKSRCCCAQIEKKIKQKKNNGSLNLDMRIKQKSKTQKKTKINKS